MMPLPEGMNTARLAREREQARRQASQHGIADRPVAARFEALDQEWWRRLGVPPSAGERS